MIGAAGSRSLIRLRPRRLRTRLTVAGETPLSSATTCPPPQAGWDFSRLSQPDFVVDHVLEPDLTDVQRDARLEHDRIGNRSLVEGVAYRQLDLALRRDPDNFQKLADIHVEAVFVHACLPRSSGQHRRAPIGKVR